MTPSLNIPTDNVYKFACIFGLAMIIVSVFSFTTIYTASLERRIEYSRVIMQTEAKAQRDKNDENALKLNKTLLEVTKTNEAFANMVLGAVIGIGLALSGYASKSWYQKIQKRDEKVALLQIEKLEHEIKKLAAEIGKMEQLKSDVTSENC